jgi:hypothetical protein
MPSIAEKLRVLVEWSPLIGLVSGVTGASTPLDRALRIFAVLRWVADKTGTEIDDQLVDLLEDILRTPEGQALFDYVQALATNLAKQEAGE